MTPPNWFRTTIALAFTVLCANVVHANQDREWGPKFAAEFAASKGPLIVYACDVHNEDSVERLIWVYPTDGSMGMEFTTSPGSKDLLIVMDFSPDKNGYPIGGDTPMGLYYWDTHGMPGDPKGLMAFRPDLPYRVVAPRPDFMAAILTDKNTPSCPKPVLPSSSHK